MACEYDMYKIFFIPGDIANKTEWDGDIKKLKENKFNKLVILNRLLSAQYYPESKNRDSERYAIYSGTNITSWSYIHSGTVGPYRLDVEEFINHSDNKKRFYRNRTTNVCYFHDDASTHEYKNKYWVAARKDTIARKYLMCCDDDDLTDFDPLFPSSVGKGGAKKSCRRIKKIISRKKSQKNKTRSSRLG